MLHSRYKTFKIQIAVLKLNKNWSAEKLYKSAKTEMDAGDYELAIEYLETIEARYPFGKLAEQAQLETAYAYYKFQEYDSAIAA